MGAARYRLDPGAGRAAIARNQLPGAVREIHAASPGKEISGIPGQAGAGSRLEAAGARGGAIADPEVALLGGGADVEKEKVGVERLEQEALPPIRASLVTSPSPAKV